MTALTLLAAVILAAAGGPAELSDGNVTLEVWSLVAAPGPAGPKDIPADLAPVRDAVKDLPYRTFRLVKHGTERIGPGKSASFQAHTDYAAVLSLESSAAEDPQARVRVVIEGPPNGDAPPRKALDTVLRLAKGATVRLGGLPADEGDLVVILRRVE